MPPPSPVTAAWQGRVFALTLGPEGNSSPDRCDEVAPGLSETPPEVGLVDSSCLVLSPLRNCSASPPPTPGYCSLLLPLSPGTEVGLGGFSFVGTWRGFEGLLEPPAESWARASRAPGDAWSCLPVQSAAFFSAGQIGVEVGMQAGHRGAQAAMRELRDRGSSSSPALLLD